MLLRDKEQTDISGLDSGPLEERETVLEHRVVLHLLHRSRRLHEESAVRVEGLLEKVARIIRTQRCNRLLNARLLLLAKALALRPLVRLRRAGRLGVRDVPLIAAVLAFHVPLLLLRIRLGLAARPVLAGLVPQR